MSSSIIELTRLSSDIVENDNDLIVDLEKVIYHDRFTAQSDNTVEGINDALLAYLASSSFEDEDKLIVDIILGSALTLDREMIEHAMDDIKYDGEADKEAYDLLAKTFNDDDDLQYDLLEFSKKLIRESVKARYRDAVRDLLIEGVIEGVEMSLLDDKNNELADFTALRNVTIHENIAQQIYDMQLAYSTTEGSHSSTSSYLTSLERSELEMSLKARTAIHNASTDETDEEIKIEDMVDRVCAGLEYDEDDVDGEVRTLIANNAELQDELAKLLSRFPESLLSRYAIPTKRQIIDTAHEEKSVFLEGVTLSSLETLLSANPFEFQRHLNMLDSTLHERHSKKNSPEQQYGNWSSLMLYALRRGEHERFAALGDTVMKNMSSEARAKFTDRLESHFSKHATAILKDAPVFVAWLNKHSCFIDEFALSLSMMIDYSNEESIELYTTMIKEMVEWEEDLKGIDRKTADLFGDNKRYIGNFSKALFLHSVNNSAAWNESKLLLTEKLPDITEAILSELSREEIDDMLTVAIYNKIQCDDDRHFTALTTALSEHANVNMSNVISSLFDLAPMLDELTDPTKAFGSFSSWISTSQRLPAVHRDNYMHLAESFYALVEHMRSERHSLDAGDITNAAILMDQIESNKKLDKLLEGEEEAPAQVRHQFTL